MDTRRKWLFCRACDSQQVFYKDIGGKLFMLCSACGHTGEERRVDRIKEHRLKIAAENFNG